MEDALLKAQHYRDRAAHLRSLAAKDENPNTHKALLQMAESCDRLYQKYLEVATQLVGEEADKSQA